MVPAIDAQYGVYVRNAAGDWTFNMERFTAYLEREGIAWPRLETGKLNMRRKTFEDMSKGCPQLEELRQLRHARDKMRKIKLAVGADGSNRTVLWPFKAKTSRTQPKASEWIFSPAVWLRSLIKPEPGMAIAYIDYSVDGIFDRGIAVRRHCGPTTRCSTMYQSGDPYLVCQECRRGAELGNQEVTRRGAVPRGVPAKFLGPQRPPKCLVLLERVKGIEPSS